MLEKNLTNHYRPWHGEEGEKRNGGGEEKRRGVVEVEGLWRRKKKGGLVKGDKELFFWCAYESERADAKLFIEQHLYDPLW